MRSARRHSGAEEDSGQDSFLDIVANIVGILILLVMVVGVRAARQPARAVAEADKPPVTAVLEEVPPAPPEQDLSIKLKARQARKRARNAEREAKALLARAAEARREVKFQDDARVQLAALVASAEEELATMRSELAEDERRDYDQRIAITEAQRQLDELTRKQAAQLSVDAEVETLENLPTPIARTVNGDEVFLMLSEGKVAVVPLDALREQLYGQLERRVRQLAGRDSISFVVGPIGGFRMRFLAEKTRVPTQNGFRIVVRPMWELLPTDDLIAEPVENATREGSALMTELAAYPARSTTVTVVAYADSFDEFRQLKQELYNRGYPVAGRPMRLGQRVIGSPRGTRSAAQ